MKRPLLLIAIMGLMFFSQGFWVAAQGLIGLADNTRTNDWMLNSQVVKYGGDDTVIVWKKTNRSVGDKKARLTETRSLPFLHSHSGMPVQGGKWEGNRPLALAVEGGVLGLFIGTIPYFPIMAGLYRASGGGNGYYNTVVELLSLSSTFGVATGSLLLTYFADGKRGSFSYTMIGAFIAPVVLTVSYFRDPDMKGLHNLAPITWMISITGTYLGYSLSAREKDKFFPFQSGD